MIRNTALQASRTARAARTSRLGVCFAAILGLCAPTGLVGVASAQEPETTNYGTFGYAAGVGGGCSSCNSCAQPCNTCQTHHCPPKLQHCMEGEPKIHVKIGCPKPIRNPCAQPNWGYYEKCWNPWPFAPNWSHCNATPPAATVALAERAYGGLTPFYGNDPQTQSAPPAQTTPRVIVPPTPAQPPYMPPMPNQPPIRTTPMPSPVPTPMPSPSGTSSSPLENLPVPRTETLRPMPGNLDDF
jgi:hypothetical protein